MAPPTPNVPESGGGGAFAFSSDSWLVQKLRSEWSSYELGLLLTREKISEALPNFQSLETPIKVRFLLAFLCMKKDEFEQNKLAIVELIDAAERDPEEWVRISSGIVKKYLFLSGKEADTDIFLRKTLLKTAQTILDQVSEQKEVDYAEDHFFSNENAYLSASIRPRLVINPTLHFSVSEVKIKDEEPVDDRNSAKKPVSHHRTPQLPRPTSVYSSSGSVGINSSSRFPPTASKPSAPKKTLTEVSTEIRKKADAGRFKRQRSRISMIDLDEIKQIESEKAQKAEERKRQKLAATKSSSNVGGTEESASTGVSTGNNSGVEDLVNSETPTAAAAGGYHGVAVPFPGAHAEQREADGQHAQILGSGGFHPKNLKNETLGTHHQSVPFPFGMGSYSSNSQFGDHGDPGFAPPPKDAPTPKEKKDINTMDQLGFNDANHAGSSGFPGWR